MTNDEMVLEAREAFVVDDEGKAAWALDKVLSARERLTRIKAACAAAVEAAQRDVADTEAFFLPLLEQWAAANPPTKGKTIRLTTGQMAWRTVPGGPRVADKAALLAWARDEGVTSVYTMREVYDVDSAAVKAYIAESGEVPPGVEVVEARESFSVKGAA